MMSTVHSSGPSLKVLISGAGIAGPCLAYWLSRTRLNTSITIVERSTVRRPTGQSIDIREQAIDIVRKMNLLDQVQDKHTTETGTVVLNRKGKPVAEFLGGEGEFTAEFEILRADLASIFLDATENLRDIKYMYGDHAKTLVEKDDGVDVTFANGSQETYDLVVGADGAGSKIRSMILDDETTKDCYRFIGQYCAYFSIPREEHDTKIWYWYNQLPGIGLMIRPHRNEKTMGCYLILTTPKWGHQYPDVEEALGKDSAEQKKVMHKYFDDAGWQAKRILKGMDECDDFYMSRAAQVKLPKWHSKRAVVMGDAAWATFGIGTSLAIDGAYFLAGELSKIQSSKDISQTLERYEEAFRPIYETMEELPPGFPQIAFPQTSWALTARDALLWTVSKTKFYKLFTGGTRAQSKWKIPEYDWVEA